MKTSKKEIDINNLFFLKDFKLNACYLLVQDQLKLFLIPILVSPNLYTKKIFSTNYFPFLCWLNTMLNSVYLFQRSLNFLPWNSVVRIFKHLHAFNVYVRLRKITSFWRLSLWIELFCIIFDNVINYDVIFQKCFVNCCSLKIACLWHAVIL